MHHFFWFLISSSSFDTLADRFYLHGQEHRTSGYQSLCNCGDYREDIQDVSLTISISLKDLLVINIPGAVLVYGLILLFELREIILASLKLK